MASRGFLDIRMSSYGLIRTVLRRMMFSNLL